MARIEALILIALVGALLAGCDQTAGGGATLGGGSVSALTGQVSGGLAAIGGDLDSESLRAAREAEYRALEFGQTGVPVTWRSGRRRGEVVPGPRYQVNSFSCRDYTHTIFRDGAPQTARGTACRQPSGVWETVT